MTLQNQIKDATRHVTEYKLKLDALTTENKKLLSLTQNNEEQNIEIERRIKENKNLNRIIDELITEKDKYKSIAMCVPKFNTQDNTQCEENPKTTSRQAILNYDALILNIGKQMSNSITEMNVAVRSDYITEFSRIFYDFNDKYNVLKEDMKKVAQNIYSNQTTNRDILSRLNETKVQLATMADADENDTLPQIVEKLRKKLGSSLCVVDVGNNKELDKNIKDRLQQLSKLCEKTGNNISGAIDTCETFAKATSEALDIKK